MTLWSCLFMQIRSLKSFQMICRQKTLSAAVRSQTNQNFPHVTLVLPPKLKQAYTKLLLINHSSKYSLNKPYTLIMAPVQYYGRLCHKDTDEVSLIIHCQQKCNICLHLACPRAARLVGPLWPNWELEQVEEPAVLQQPGVLWHKGPFQLCCSWSCSWADHVAHTRWCQSRIYHREGS